MGNWRFGAFPKLPYSTMQQLNLDWILDRIRRFLPDTGTKGQVLTRTKDGAAWQDVSDVAGSVNSVNGKTGDVVLTASDVGAMPDSYTAPVSSVNGQTGNVSLGAADVGALPDTYTAPVTSVNGQTGNVVISGGGAVDSVNGQTGAVVLTASDVGAIPDTTTIPTKTSDLNNDSGFITLAQAPVQSVAGKTGSVLLNIDDVYLRSRSISTQRTVPAGGAVNIEYSFSDFGIANDENMLIFICRQYHQGTSDDVWHSLFIGWSYDNTTRKIYLRCYSQRTTVANPTFILEAIVYKRGA